VFFVLHYTDRITSVLTGDQTPSGREITQSRNTGEANIAGIEFSSTLHLSDALDAGLVLNYLHGEQNDIDGRDVAADRIPPLNGRLSFTYQLNESASIEPYVVFAGAQSRLSPRDIQDSRIDPGGTPGWLTANIAGNVEIGDRWRITARIENLLDKRYRMHGSGIDSTGQNLYLGFRTTW
jgi:outer membrane receptor protein involved in Fe transport